MASTLAAEEWKKGRGFDFFFLDGHEPGYILLNNLSTREEPGGAGKGLAKLAV